MASQQKYAPFFDLETYFNQEITRLEQQQIRLKKRISLGDKTEEKILTEYDLSDELTFFLDANINKTAWLDQYTVDSIFVQKTLSGLRYLAKNEDLKIKKVTIDFENQTVAQIEIIKRNPTIIADAEQQLKYQPKTGYSIEHLQEIRLGKPQVLKIEVDFLP